MKTCATLFWSIVVLVTTFGTESWVLKGWEIEVLRKFQRQIGRRCQRYSDRTPNTAWLVKFRQVNPNQETYIPENYNLSR